MTTDIKTALKGYNVNEYLLVLSPPEALWQKILQEKERFAVSWQSDYARKSHPYITMAKFTQYELMETRILSRIRAVAMSVSAFIVDLKDYGSFPSHTIYINVTSKIPIQNLVKELRSHTQRFMKMDNDHKPLFITEPHIPVARKLLPWQYEKSWQEYHQQSFSGRFIAESMVLLKRSLGEKPYQNVHQFDFLNQSVPAQGVLF